MATDKRISELPVVTLPIAGSNARIELLQGGINVQANPDDLPGGAGVGVSFVDKITPTGLVNSSNTVYTLPSIPLVGSDYVWLNGQLQTSGYSLVGTTLTFVVPPTTGDELRVSYRLFSAPVGDGPPCVVYANQAAMLANTEREAGQFTYVTDTGSLYIFNGGARTNIANYTLIVSIGL